MKEPWLTRSLANWLASLDTASIPESVRHEAGLRILDSIGVAFAGRHEPGVRTLVALSSEPRNGNIAPVLGHARSAEVRDAALINGTMGHVLDFDDSILPSRMHASAGLAAGLFALGHSADLHGSDLMRGFVAGYEVAVRLMSAMHTGAYRAGWHGVLGSVTIAAGGAAMSGADAETTERILGIAASQGAGIMGNKGSMTKSLHTGKAASSGVLSVLLGLNGFTSNPGSLDDPPGGRYVRIYGGDPADVQLDDLGQQWAILRSAIKPYACGVVAHPAIDGAIALRSDDALDIDDITRIVVEVPSVTMELMGAKAPASGLAAKFSVPYVVSAALVHGHGGPTLFDDDAQVANPEVQRLMSRLDVVIDDELGQDQARVTAETSDGGARTEFVEAALGSIGNPVGEAGIRDKFRSLMAQQGESERGSRLESLLADVEHHEVREVTALF